MRKRGGGKGGGERKAGTLSFNFLTVKSCRGEGAREEGKGRQELFQL